MRCWTAALVGGLMLAPALAHDIYGRQNWIYHGAYKSPIDGSHCCGENDCVELPDSIVRLRRDGYDIDGLAVHGAGAGAKWLLIEETVPHREVQASKDGKYWRCHKPDKSRRCFFAPPPAT